VDGLQRVTFRFEAETQVHYVDPLPELGERVAHRGELWVVVGVETDQVGALVTCARQHSPTPSLDSVE
jgi:hypothetical protein